MRRLDLPRRVPPVVHPIPPIRMLLFCACILLFGLADAGMSRARARPSKHVLVLYENNRLLPANVQGDRGINEVISSSGENTVVSAEFLDAPRFNGETYVQTVQTFLREKYRADPPDVIVAGGNGALEFLLNSRADFFPSVPVVHMGVDGWFAKARQPLPTDIVGVPVEYDFAGTIEQALKWHPNTTRLVVVTGASAPDLELETLLRTTAGQIDGPVTTEFLAGLPTSAVLKRLGELDDDAVVFTPGYFEDGAGRVFVPREAAREMAAASTAPVYGPYNTFIGVGIVGGAMPSFEAMGREAGSIVNRLLAGAAPASLRLPQLMPTTLNVDWRQVRRWGIDEDAMPPDAIVHFRTPSFWETYRMEALTGIAIVLLQSGLLAGLLVERRRRRGAELAVDKHRFELAHASRLAIAGELTASIAHEINQPLGAILSNVSAAELMLGSGTNDLNEVRQILGDIHRDNLRASEVIRRLRTLLAKHEVERRVIDLNESLADMATILRAEAQRRRVSLAIRPELPAVEVLADRIQIQQILLNLALNAMDAVSDMADERRTVMVSAEQRSGMAAITVRDYGHGIAEEHLPKLFDSFFSTKRTGIGLGLSIVRTLVEAQGGKVWAENGPGDGATFHVDLPLAGSSAALRGASG
jgi:signal transduction histidine kinase